MTGLTILLIFRCGISYFFKRLTEVNANNYSEVKGTGFSTGTIHGYQYCPLLFQLLFALVPKENILPDTPQWWRDFVEVNDAGPEINIFSNVISTITTCLDFYFLSVKRCFDEPSLNALHAMTGNMRAQLMILHKIRNYLIKRVSKKNPDVAVNNKEEKDNYFQAIKPHLCEHMLNSIRVFGAIVITSDTQQSERVLKTVCKENFEQTSKHYKNLQSELIGAFRKNLRASDLRKYVDRRKEHSEKGSASSRQNRHVEAPSFHDYAGFSSKQLAYNPSGSDKECFWELKDRDKRDYLHKLLTVKQLMYLLATTTSIASHVFRLNQASFHSRGYLFTILLYRGVNVYNSHHVTDDHLKNETFTIHCNNGYSLKKKVTDIEEKSVFSFIEVQYFDNTCSYCRVMAIVDIAITVKGKPLNQQYLIVCRLAIASVASPLPFRLFTYEVMDTSSGGFELCLDVISIGSAFRPCIAHSYEPNVSRGQFQTMTNKDKFCHQNMFFVIPYDRLGKSPNTNWLSDDPAVVYAEDGRMGISLPLMASTDQQAFAMQMAEQQLPGDDPVQTTSGQKRQRAKN